MPTMMATQVTLTTDASNQSKPVQKHRRNYTYSQMSTNN